MEINYQNIQPAQQIHLYTLFQTKSKFNLDFTDFEYEMLSSKDHSNIIQNIVDGYPLKPLIFKEDLAGRLHPFAMTKEVLYAIHLFLNVNVIVESFDKLPESVKARVETYKFTYIVQKPSEEYDVRRVCQY